MKTPEEMLVLARKAVAQAMDELGFAGRQRFREPDRLKVEDRALDILREWDPPEPPRDDEDYRSCETHCCAMHGCKYGLEGCPVVCGRETQMYPCEQCGGHQEHEAFEQVAHAAKKGHPWAQETLQHAWALATYLGGYPRREPRSMLPEPHDRFRVALRNQLHLLNPRDVALVLDFIRERMEVPPSGD